jgi:protein TonB
MRRHRQKNTLLPKMMGIAVIIVILMLPLLAKLGVFRRARGQNLSPVSLVKLPPPDKSAAERKRAKKAPTNHPESHGSKSRASGARSMAPNPNQPKVVAGGAGGSDDDTSINNNGTAAPGQLSAGGGSGSGQPKVAENQAPVSTPPTQPKKTPIPASAPITIPPPVKHQPVIVAAQPVDCPEPIIPDELRNENRSTTYFALFSVKASGAATVTEQKGTGNRSLDQIALETARKWTFHPATRDGQPVDSYLRLQIEFKVSD